MFFVDRKNYCIEVEIENTEKNTAENGHFTIALENSVRGNVTAHPPQDLDMLT